MIKYNFFIHVQTSFNYETTLIDLYHATLLTTISNREAVAASKSKVLFKQSQFYMTAFYSKTLVNSDVVVWTFYERARVIKSVIT